MFQSFKIARLISHFEELMLQGIPLVRILENSSIRQEQALDPEFNINTDQLTILYDNIYRLNDDPMFGFKIGVRKNPANFGIPMQAVLGSKTFYEAAERSYRLKHILLPGAPIHSLPYEYIDNIYHLRLKYLVELKKKKPMLTEITLVSINSIGEAMRGKHFPIAALNLAYEKPSNHAFYEKVFRCPVQFNCEHTEMILEPEVVHSPSILRNAAFADYAEKIAVDQHRQAQESVGFIDKVTNAVSSHKKPYPNLEEISKYLCMSPRTLHRKLDKCGTSFQKLTDSIKQSYAEQYILHSKLSIEEIAGEVGFASSNSFRVAFKNWTALTPTEFRSKYSSERSNFALN